MPAKVKQMGGLWRVVESETEALVRNAAGKPVDGGGHNSRAEAQRQATAINLAELSRDEDGP